MFLDWPCEGGPSNVLLHYGASPIVCLVFTFFGHKPDRVLLSRFLAKRQPKVVVTDSHPKIGMLAQFRLALNTDMAAWNCEVNTASMGRPKSRMRLVTVSVIVLVRTQHRMSAIHILAVCLPGSTDQALQRGLPDASIIEG